MNAGFAVAMAVGLFATAAPAATVAATTPEQDAQISALTNEIKGVAARLPAGSPENAYEAQFAALFANNQYSCTIVRAAISRASVGSKVATVALRNVNNTLTNCGGGTAAVPGGPLNTANTPGFAVGGSDYTP
jgi:hypothetical protein